MRDLLGQLFAWYVTEGVGVLCCTQMYMSRPGLNTMPSLNLLALNAYDAADG